MWVAHSAAILAISAFVCAGLVVILRPWLQRYALARPNARSSHREPTPQGGGIAVIIATVAGACFGISGFDTSLGVILAATMIIACAGAAADIRPITIALRLGIQTIAVALVIFALPDGLRVAAFLPWWVERGLLLVAGLWFVNLVNFMDGLDWMTVAEVVPVTGTLAAIGFMGLLPAPAIVVSLALCGAMIGFAYFNRPLARTLSRRRRQSSHRACYRLAFGAGRRPWWTRGSNPVAFILCRRQYHHAALARAQP